MPTNAAKQKTLLVFKMLLLYLLNPSLWAERLMGRTILWLRAKVPEEIMTPKLKQNGQTMVIMQPFEKRKLFHEDQ